MSLTSACTGESIHHNEGHEHVRPPQNLLLLLLNSFLSTFPHSIPKQPLMRFLSHVFAFSVILLSIYLDIVYAYFILIDMAKKFSKMHQFILHQQSMKVPVSPHLH